MAATSERSTPAPLIAETPTNGHRDPDSGGYLDILGTPCLIAGRATTRAHHRPLARCSRKGTGAPATRALAARTQLVRNRGVGGLLRAHRRLSVRFGVWARRQ